MLISPVWKNACHWPHSVWTMTKKRWSYQALHWQELFKHPFIPAKCYDTQSFHIFPFEVDYNHLETKQLCSLAFQQVNIASVAYYRRNLAHVLTVCTRLSFLLPCTRAWEWFIIMTQVIYQSTYITGHIERKWFPLVDIGRFGWSYQPWYSSCRWMAPVIPYYKQQTTGRSLKWGYLFSNPKHTSTYIVQDRFQNQFSFF